MPVILFVVSIAAYIATLAPSITTGDAGELCASAVTLGIAHSPGYPLFSLVGKIFTVIIPWGDLAYRINAASAVFACSSAVILYFLLLKAGEIFQNSVNDDGLSRATVKTAAFITALSFVMTKSVWQSGVQTEVFTLNIFFALLIAYAILRDNLLLASFLFGLGLGNHHTLVFISPVFLYPVIRSKALNIKTVLTALAVFALGFSVYLYLPARSFNNPQLDWGNTESLKALWRVISRADYGTLSLTVGEKIQRNFGTLSAQASRFFTALGRQYTLIGLITGTAGLYFISRKRPLFLTLAALTFVLSGPAFLLLANMPFNAEAEGVLERFYVFINLGWSFALFAGLIYLASLKKIFISAGAAVVIVLLLNAPSNSMRGSYLAYDYGSNLLKTMKPGAVLFMDGGDDTFYSLAYLCFARNKRPDLELHDRGGLVFKNVYGKDFRALSKEEKESRRRKVESGYLGVKPVYFSTFNKTVMGQPALVSDGILYRPADKSGINAFHAYSLRNIYGGAINDYRSNALAPIYPYFAALYSANPLPYWRYCHLKWSYVPWIKTNVKAELLAGAFDSFSGNRYAQAERFYKEINRIYPDEPSAFLNLGVVYEKIGKEKEALDCYARVSEIDPKNTDSYYNTAVIWWKKADWEKAAFNLRRVLAVNPSDERARHFLPVAEQNIKQKK